jgi:hypothetical protein
MSLHERRQYMGYFPSRRYKHITLAIFAVIGFWSYWAFSRGIIFATMYVITFGQLAVLFLLLWE